MTFVGFIAQESSKGGNALISLAPLLLIFVAMYFLMIRPQQRRARAQRELQGSIDEGDEVLTVGGMFGTVIEVYDDSMLVEVSPGTRIRFVRNAIARKIVPDDYEAEDEEADEEP